LSGPSPYLTHPAAKDLLAHRGREPGDLLAGDLRWQSQRARVGDQVDERGARLRQCVPHGCLDVRGLAVLHRDTTRSIQEISDIIRDA